MALTKLTKPRAIWATFKSKLAGAIERILEEKLTSYSVDILDFGAHQDGVTDSSPALVTALALGRNVYLPPIEKGYFFSGTFVLGEGQSVYGANTKIHTDVNGALFNLSSKASVHDVEIYGSGKAGQQTNQTFIYINNNFSTKVYNIGMYNCSGTCYAVGNAVDKHQGNVLTNFVIKDCNKAVNFLQRGEFTKVTAGSVAVCNTAFEIRGGNNNITGVIVSDNVDAFVLKNGSNDAHGVVSGCTINHNTNILKTERLQSNEFLFDGNMMYYGHIDLVDCEGIKFTNNDMHTNTIREEGCSDCWFIGNAFKTVPVVTPNDGSPSEVFYLDNQLPKGTSPTGKYLLNGGLLRVKTTSNVLYNTGDTDLLWDAIDARAIGFNLQYSVQKFYDLGDNNPYIRADRDFIRGGIGMGVNLTLMVGKQTSAAWESKEVEVLLMNNSGYVVGRATPSSTHSSGASNVIHYTFSGLVPRNAFKVVIRSSVDGVYVYRDQTGESRSYMEVSGW